jgi:outer membrane protein TolC
MLLGVALMLTAGALVAQQLEPPAAGGTLTLEQALRRALEANPSTNQARTNVTQAEAQRRVARSSILPHIDLYGSATRNSDEVSFGEGDDATTILARNDWKYSLQLSQPVYAGGRELRAIRQAGLAVDLSKETVRGSEDAIILQTAANYLAAVQGDALVNVESRNLELAKRRRQQAADFLEAGESTKVDVLRAETAIKAAERRVAAARQFREDAASRLRMNLAIDHPVVLTNPRLALPPLPTDADLVQRSEEQNPNVRQARISHEIARLETRKQRAGYLPIVTAQASMNAQKVPFPIEKSNAISLNLWVPIFQSGEIESRIAVARSNEREAELVLDDARRTVRESVQTSILDLRTAETNLALAKEQLAAAQAEYDQTFELYRSQEATTLDLSTAETALAEAQRAVVTGSLDRDLAELRVWYVAGSLKDVVLTEDSKS